MAAAQGKVIITCAVSGSMHIPTMSPHPPITPRRIADESVAAAAIIQRHARDRNGRRPTPDPLEIANPDEARSMLKPQGSRNVSF